MRLLDSEHLKRFERHLDDVAKRLLFDQHGQSAGSLSQLLHLYVMRPGKRIRPQLVIWTYLQQSGRLVGAQASVPDHVLDTACAWELFHAFLLVHDDIIDGSDRRRDEPAMHRQLQSLDSNSPRFGVNLGIVAGDLLYAAVNELLSDLDVPADEYRELHRLFARIAALTGRGQAIDILQSHTPLARCDEATLLHEYCWKTAAYTFEGPMLTGAILGGLNTAAREAISAFGIALGQAYQLQNDLHDLAEPARQGSDMSEGKRTVTLLRARTLLADDDARHAFDADLAHVQVAEGRAIEIAESLRGRVISSGAVQATQEIIAAFLNTAEAAARSPVLPGDLANGLTAMLGELRGRYFCLDPVTMQ